MKAVVIGSINMDFNSTVDHLPVKGETITAGRFKESPGGKGANQAVALSRLGGDVTMIGVVGGDGTGKSLIEVLKDAGIPDGGIKVADTATGSAFITVDKQGSNTIVVYPGANYQLDMDWVEGFKDEIAVADYVVAQMEVPTQTVEESIKLAHELGTRVILNPAPARPIAEGIYPMMDVIAPNETELKILTGTEDIRKGAGLLLAKGVKSVVVTLGSQGCYYTDGKEEITAEGFKVDAVDSTAAGDAFIAGLAFKLGICGVREALEFANAVGAVTVTKPGAQDSIPTYKEVQEFLRRRKK